MADSTMSYTSLTADERACWDALVSECAECAEQDSEEPCATHDLADMTPDELAGLILAWRAEGGQ